MSDPTDIEKKSLEAHVELCAERYKFLEEKLEDVEAKITALGALIGDLTNKLSKFAEKRNDQVLKTGFALVGVLFGIIGYLLATYVIK